MITDYILYYIMSPVINMIGQFSIIVMCIDYRNQEVLLLQL